MSSAAVAAARGMWGQSPDAAKLSRIGVMSLCFESSILKDPAHPDDPKRTLDLMDFPDAMAERLGVHNVEIQHEHFFSTEPAYFQQFLARVKKAKSRVSQINLEFGPLNVSAKDPIRRLETIDLSKRWIDHAVTLGCPRVMVNQGTLEPALRPAAIEALKSINTYAKTKKVFITFEVRGKEWEAQLEVIKAAGILPHADSAGFRGDEEARVKALRLMYPNSDGNSHVTTGSNIADSVKIAKELGYKGLYTIEGRGRGDPYAEVKANIDVVLANM
jgi:sugar phosphate isomerase/epimerase